ncbi:MAG TPA: PAS domain-containing protein [Stellaceae bacterium]|nr:PAS domain-containing protein [Stellaceae bacterium]
MDPSALKITDPRLAEALAYWRRKCAGRAMPGRADIDPVEIPKLLPHVMLVDVLGPGRYRYRLIGTENAIEHGINATGLDLEDVLTGPDYRAHVLNLYDECVAARRPLYSESLFLSPQSQIVERHTKVLFMPLSEDGETVSIVFVIQVFVHRDQTARERHLIEPGRYREIAHHLL